MPIYFIPILTICQVVYENAERNEIFSRAKAKAIEVNKPLLNAGCGALKLIGGFPRAIRESDINLDVKYRDVPNFVLADIENIPYPDRYFGAAFCCHVLEHVDDWKGALAELYRVSDNVFVVVPEPVWPSTWLHPGHKRVFVGDALYKEQELIESQRKNKVSTVHEAAIKEKI